jgi:hypothetical protein
LVKVEKLSPPTNGGPHNGGQKLIPFNNLDDGFEAGARPEPGLGSNR